MGSFFTRERFGRPQVFAGLLLLAFLSQCLWLVNRSLRSAPQGSEIFRIRKGLELWRSQSGRVSSEGHEPWSSPLPEWLREDDANHSPMWYLIAAAPLLLSQESFPPESASSWLWLARAPYLLFGVLLGVSLWYVSRRLYGNAGGYIALGLYCFSPGVIRSSAAWYAEPEVGAAWGAFGVIFTAIAVAHTLYAPREVIVWNWRRILLLGLSSAMAVGSQFSLLIVIPAALAFMLYLAPARRAAATVTWVAACVAGWLLLYASYFFHYSAFRQGIRQASLLDISWRAFAMPGAYQQVIRQLGQTSPALLVAVPIALATYIAWPRARYFGNTVPLLVTVLLMFLALGNPHYPGLGFQFIAVPFLFVFVAGVSADLLETRLRNLVLAFVLGLLLANAIWNIWHLARASALISIAAAGLFH